MKSPRQPDGSDRPLTRSEKFSRRGGPLLIGGAAVATVVYLLAQTGTQAEIKAEHTQAAVDANNEEDAYQDALRAAAIKVANLEDMADPALIVIPNNKIALYDEAPRVAQELGLVDGPNADQMLEDLRTTSVAISAAGLIHPGSGFVLTNVDVDKDGDEELIVQPAPAGYGESVE